MRPLLVFAAGAIGALAPATHRLEATPPTIACGWYDAAARPVLRIASGEIPEVDALLDGKVGVHVKMPKEIFR